MLRFSVRVLCLVGLMSSLFLMGVPDSNAQSISVPFRYPIETNEGTYCNRLSEADCDEVVVDADGRLEAQLAPMSALAIDIGLRENS